MKHTPSVYRQFPQGYLTRHTFSSIALDQNHEVTKGDGGAVGLDDNSVVLLRWMVAGPKIARLVNEFDEHIDKDDAKHHEQSAAAQAEFRN